jgi:hypothetical protein
MSDPQGRSPEVVAFLEEVLAVCDKHKLSISHEDGHGAFLVVPINFEDRDWLSVASDDTGEVSS